MGLLRCRLKQIPDGGVSFTHSAWKGWGEGLAPDALSWEGNQLPQENFSPFGDGLSIFTAFQFSSREAFSKAGAVITVDFALEYYKVPIEQAYEPDPIRYRSVMTREDFEGSRSGMCASSGWCGNIGTAWAGPGSSPWGRKRISSPRIRPACGSSGSPSAVPRTWKACW